MVLVNPSFVMWWTKPEYFGGNWLNVLLAVYVVTQVYLHCFGYAFTLHKVMRLWTVIETARVIVALVAIVFGVYWFGLAGVPAGLIVVSLLGGSWFVLFRGARLIGVSV